MTMAKGSLVSPELRSTARARIEPVARLFGRAGLTPNALTVIGLGIAVVAGVAAASQAWLAAGLLVIFGAAFDLFDGAVARATGQTTKFGAFLDSTLDRAGEAVVYVGIAVGLSGYLEPGASALPGVVAAMTAMAAAFMVSYTRAKSESLGFASGTGMANVGMAPREVRIGILTVALVVAGFLRPTGGILPLTPSLVYWWYVLLGALALITILATITTVQRILAVRGQGQSQTQPEETR
jgi:CDP-diacylglycerol--glycerol-3-phosphate 3-phosphatidyltransferase